MEQISKWQENFLPLAVKDLPNMTDEQVQNIVRMNNLFCGAHVIINMGTVCKESLKEYENIAATNLPAVVRGFNKGGAGGRTFGILYEISKALTKTHNYMKAGAVHYWSAYLEEHNLKNHFISFKGERINVIFVMGAAAYFHRHHVLDFIEKHSVQENSLLDAIRDLEISLIQATCRALGILGKLVTGPLFRLISERDHIFKLNDTWQQVYNNLKDLCKDARPLMEEKDIVPGGKVVKDELYTELFKETNDAELDSLCESCLRMLCCAISILIHRQLADQMTGGVYYQPSQEILI